MNNYEQLANFARTLGPHGDAMTARAGDWPRLKPEALKLQAGPEELTLLEKGGDQAEGLEEGGGDGNSNDVKIANFEIGILGIVWGWISTTGSGRIMDWNLLLPKLFFSHRDFAASRLRVIPLISHEGHRRREEAMIADLRHYPAMKKRSPFTLCVLCELCELCG